PPHRPGLRVDLLLEEKLVLVTTGRDGDGDGGAEGFVAVDWGPDFAREYAASFPQATSPGLSANLGPLALDYILAVGGSGYFRMHVVEPLLASGRLRLVSGAPQFSYPIYVVHSAEAEQLPLGPALAGLRAVAKAGPH